MISVCIATHNGQKHISEQLQSILKQIDIKDEVLISDDNSTDHTLNIIRIFNDKRIKIYTNNFASPIKNFEFLIGLAKGDIIFLSDQDDIWDSKKVYMHLQTHNTNSKVKLVISNVSLIDANGKSLNRLFYKEKFTSSFLINLYKNNFIGCSISFNKAIKKHILPFPQNIPMHDWWIGLISILFYKVEYITEKLVYYRIHENNFTQKNKYTLFEQAKFRIILLYLLFTRVVKHLFT
jgi:glycosyltransferase involved in cell wall biosynthesis